MSRQAWLTPDALPAGLRSCVLQFPDSEEWHALVRGCLFLLSEERNFEEFGSVSVAEVADTFRQTLFSFLEEDCLPMPPIGSVLSFAGSSAPAGYLLCDWAQYNQADYPALYAVIQLFFGAADAGKFRVPDLRGRLPAGLDASQTEFSTRGIMGGVKTHTLTVAQLPVVTVVQDSHNHTQTAHNHTQTAHAHNIWGDLIGAAATLRRNLSTVSGASNVASDLATATNQAATATNQAATATNQSFGSGASHNNLQPYTVLNYIIRAL